ncbi:MAG: hypothetical protein A3K19_07815 [Lentisphaerae bacterium RIFOXYB12_FULL_65_16]|nr:MAG: hypothetical protein A3K18_07330 [Lentisphaerae bacterium RIFOXYA12_64_32]OGV87553.1 MAG: hypothetical protein A3K19_07815 [Lentisphaerae bacterium RIFOXYB12_FULL_65_16]
MPDAINIGNRRELFWDEYLIDTQKTTAQLRLHQPQAREVVIDHNLPWEGDGCDFYCILKDAGLYRLYYLGWEMMNPETTRLLPRPVVVCYAESQDGRTWTKPDLGICEFEGSTANNIILDKNTAAFDNFSVFKDTNPDCPRSELYKGVGLGGKDYLWCFTSEDGIHFRKSWPMTNHGKFDTLNIAFWDKHTNQYICYIRNFHSVPGNDLNAGIRDVRWMVSRDFKGWTIPVLLDFGGADDYPLYTNVVQPYYRADHMYVGFPSRYVEKKQWTSNFDQLAGAAERKTRMKLHPRYGLAITDCVFMSSRDGKTWKRWDEAFMTPGLEHERNWVYGDCYPALGMIETANDLTGAPNELSMYTFDNHWSRTPAKLRRHTIRVDGFVSYHATYKPCTVATKPFIFEGRSLSINFATSAIGYLKIRLVGEGLALDSCELFGDSLDRRVVFEAGDVAALSGKPVTMEITMSDADICSFKFGE